MKTLKKIFSDEANLILLAGAMGVIGSIMFLFSGLISSIF